MHKQLFFVSVLLIIGAGCVNQAGRSPVGDLPDQYDSPFDASKLQEAPPVPAPESAEAQPQPHSQAAETEKTMTTWKFPGILPAAEISGKQVRIKTAKGDIVFKLYEKDAPKTVSNFVYLTKGGYYDGLTFHRREEGFVIQGGDPNGNGTGGPGYRFEDEQVTRQYTKGIVAMANAGPDTNGSQFFIMLGDNPLPPAYTIFGEVTSGMDAVAKIRVGDVMTKVSVENAN